MSSVPRRTSGSVLSPPASNAVSASEIDAVFMTMFKEHRDRIYSTALRLSGRRPDAEDLTAEAFLRAYRSLSSFDDERLETLQPRPWLTAIVVNQWRNQCRNASRRPLTVSSAAIEPEPVDELCVEQQVELHEEGRRLAAMLVELPERQRIAVVLRYIGDLPVGEIAEVMGCPDGTVKSLISRGLGRLRPSFPGQGIHEQSDDRGGLR
jgi:RNA polymerase sigma factor (sigma-70 family)